MKSISLCLVVAFALTLGSVDLQANDSFRNNSLSFGKSSAEEILNAAYEQIEWYESNQFEVTQEMYDFYFKFERLVNPDVYAEIDSRTEGRGALDQLADACPGTQMIMPEEGELTIVEYGSTLTAVNNCSYPDCRYGRDVVAQIEVSSFGTLEISTCGSAFDTYLCLYEDGCCGEEGSNLISENNNYGFNCGQRLTSYIIDCVSPGTYYLVLDGASTAAKGSYRLSVSFSDFCE